MISIKKQVSEDFVYRLTDRFDELAGKWFEITKCPVKSPYQTPTAFPVGTIIYITMNGDVLAFDQGEIKYLVGRENYEIIERHVDCELTVRERGYIPF